MDLRKEIANLRSLTPELNTVTDRAATLVLAVEHFLTEECQLAIAASFQLTLGHRDSGATSYGIQLGYARWEGKFCLIVADFEAHDGYETVLSDKMPWVNCTRDRKLATVELIPRLLQRIGERIRSTISDAKKQAVTVEKYLSDLGIDVKEAK